MTPSRQPQTVPTKTCRWAKHADNYQPAGASADGPTGLPVITGDVTIVRTEISSNVTADGSAAFPGGEPGHAGAAGAGGGIATTPFASQPTIFELRNRGCGHRQPARQLRTREQAFQAVLGDNGPAVLVTYAATPPSDAVAACTYPRTWRHR